MTEYARAAVYRVAQAPEGRWVVTQQGEEHTPMFFEQRDEAITAAVALAKNARTARVEICDVYGELESELYFGLEEPPGDHP